MIKLNVSSSLEIPSGGSVFIFVTKEMFKSGGFYPELTRDTYLDKLFSAEPNEVQKVYYKGIIYFIIGLGYEKDLTLSKLRTYVKSGLTYIGDQKQIFLEPHKDDLEVLRAYIDGIFIGIYSFDKYKSKTSPLAKVVFKSKYKKEAAVFKTIVEGVNLARDLVNDNADVVNSTFIEKKIREIIKGKPGISLKVVDEKEMKAAGMNLFLSVNKASQYPPKLLIVKYNGNVKSKSYDAILGKGLTFDSGGLNLKPTNHIETMKSDMAGTASVIGILYTLLHLKPKRNILFACAVAENSIDSKAYKPGDILKSMNGKTVHVLNTDAEGRLVLADSITYICRNYKIKCLIDLATLTGSVIYALGYDHTGMVSNSEALSGKITQAAKITDDRVWSLPMYEELEDHIKSDIADINNEGRKRQCGAMSAAEFLRQFVEPGIEWAHLDIAGTAYMDAPQWYYCKGATGAGIRLLCEVYR